VVSNTTGNNQWENCILLDFNFLGLSEMYIYLSSTKPEIYSRLPHMHTVTGRLGALLPVVFETTNSRTHGSMHFVEITKIGAYE
jgi:hypothetical protein